MIRLVAGAFAVLGLVTAAGGTEPAAAMPAPREAAPAFPAGLPQGWYATIETSLGAFVVRLFPEQAPQSVAHFVAFAEGRMSWTDPFTGQPKTGPYYDGLTIHKIVPFERLEAGDPTATGRGAPLVYVPDESGRALNFSHPYRVGLTRSAGARINGAQFFVTATSQPYLSGRHPCIGEVVVGRDVVDRICAVKRDGEGKPTETVGIVSVRIAKIGDPAPIPDAVPYTPPNPKFGRKTP